MDDMLSSCFFVCIQLERNAMSDIYSSLASMELMVPNVTSVCLTGVSEGKKPNTTVLIFRHPEDKKGNQYESIILTHTVGANLPANNYTDESGDTRRVVFNLGSLHLISFLQAVDASDDEIREVMTASRDERVEMLKRYVGECVTCPMTGRVKGGDGVTRVGFKFEDIDWDDYTDFINRQKKVFGPDFDLGPALEREEVRKRNTRPDNAVVPMSMEDGDELID